MRIRELASILSALRDQGVGMLVVTHDLGFAEAIADEVWILDPGEQRLRSLAGGPDLAAAIEAQLTGLAPPPPEPAGSAGAESTPASCPR